ncbi:MAG TPA: type II toxin-antitoxin system VapB family antitoxin [Thermoanaerobaculia bacterium]|jgi:antitoxin VapB|nr:type II toxin-antitoxin system VapB family antitoxin [Thermoanaerobaculia bacterium]
MALTIENPETERLAVEVAKLTGESQEEAVRKALQERKQRLAPPEPEPEDRVARWRLFLEKEVRPNILPEFRGKRITKEEREEILGYGPDGV